MTNEPNVLTLSANRNDASASSPLFPPLLRCIALLACELFFFVALISISDGILFWVAIAMVVPTLFLTWQALPASTSAGQSIGSLLKKINGEQIDLRSHPQTDMDETS